MSRRNESESMTPKLAREQRRRELEDIAWLLDQPRGRRIMWRVFGIAGIFRNSFTGSSETFFNEGKRAIGTTLFADLMEAVPGAFPVMQAEAVKQAEADELAALAEREESNG